MVRFAFATWICLGHQMIAQGQVRLEPDFQGSVDIIDFKSGTVETLVSPKPYDSLSPEFQKRVERDTYEKMNRVESIESFFEAGRFSDIVGGDIVNLRRKMDSIRQDPRLIEFLELTPKQNASFDEIEKSYLKIMEEMKLKKAPPIVIDRIGQNYLSQFNEVFSTSQVRKIEKLTVEFVGLPKLLTETPYGDIVVLSETQKAKIRSKSQKLADEIEEFVAKKKQEAAKLVFEELTEDQRSSVRNLFEEEALDHQMGLPLEQLHPSFDYRNNGNDFHENDLEVWKKKFDEKK